ncbi:MAG: AAA family ATPase [Thermoguttaceae bacterium]|jgi:uncharacterized protein YhaN
MRIVSLEIERFGIWENLYLPKIRRGINVFYGPNEAGKTTLMQFIRSCLYGCGNQDRARYIQMALAPRTESPFAENRLSPTEIEVSDPRRKKKDSPEDTRWIGGALTVQDDYGVHRLERRYIRKSALALYGASSLEQKAGFIVSGGLAAWSGRFFPVPGTGIAESLVISGEDGQRLSDHFVQSIVNNVDEATFNNVFAIGLDELQKLGSLNETDAAQMLYRLSVGVDRVSLIQVLHQIVEERNEIFDIKGKPAILDSLLARRDALNEKSLSATANLREYAGLRSEQMEAEEAVRKLEEKLAVHTRRRRIYEIAARIAPQWDLRAELRVERAEYGAVPVVEPNAVAEAESKLAAIADVRRSLAALGTEFRQTRKTLKSLSFNRSIWRNAPLIEMLLGEIPHLTDLDRKVAGVQGEIAAIQKELDLEEQRLRGARSGKTLLTSNLLQSIVDPATGLPASEPVSRAAEQVGVTASVPEAREIEDFRIPARAVFSARKRYAKTRDLSNETNQRVKSLSAELDQELSARGQRSLDEAITATGELVAQLRRRLEISKRIGDLDKIKRELTRQNGFLVANQSLPYPITIAIGIGVALGGLLAVFSIFGQEAVEPSLGILGILVAVSLLFYKTAIERRNYARLGANQRQLAAVMKRTDQVKAEAAAIDQKYPAPGQAIESRLQRAEADLAAFERLLPVDARRKDAVHRQAALEKRLLATRRAVSAAHHRWSDWLKTAGLSPTLKPSQVKRLLHRVDFADTLRRRIEEKKGLLKLYLKEKKGITDRLDLLLGETRTPALDNATAIEQINHLSDLLDEVRLIRQERSDLSKKLSGFRKDRNNILGKIHRMNVDLDDFLSFYDSKSVDHLKELAARYKSHQELLDRIATVESQIEGGIGGYCEEAEIAEVLDDESVRPNLPALIKALDERVEKLSSDKKEKTLRIGRLTEQLANLAAQRDAVGYRFESAAISRRIDEISRIWQSRAVACKIMEDIRRAYEKERQPETLKEASRLLKRLTDGLYEKIWTPLGEDTLYVDTKDGQTLDIGSLSRGTREQLFIAIRLALAVSFEKHGVNLPLILDDVLVNFDNRRAAAAADVLSEFAEAGRQIFIFTCHQHICKTFLARERPVFVLPDKAMKVKQFRVILPPSMRQMPDEPEEKFEPKPIPITSEFDAPRVISPVSTAVPSEGGPAAPVYQNAEFAGSTEDEDDERDTENEFPDEEGDERHPDFLLDDEETDSDDEDYADDGEDDTDTEDGDYGDDGEDDDSEDEDYDDDDEDDDSEDEDYDDDDEDDADSDDEDYGEDDEDDTDSDDEDYGDDGEDDADSEDEDYDDDGEDDDDSEDEDYGDDGEDDADLEDEDYDDDDEDDTDTDDEDYGEDDEDDTDSDDEDYGDDGEDDADTDDEDYDDDGEDDTDSEDEDYADDGEDDTDSEDEDYDDDGEDDTDSEDEDYDDDSEDDTVPETGDYEFEGEDEEYLGGGDDEFEEVETDDDEADDDAEDIDETDEADAEDDGEVDGYVADESTFTQDHPSISAGADHTPVTPSFSSEEPDVPQSADLSVEAEEGTDFGGDDDDFEAKAVSAEQVAAINDDTPEGEPKKADSFEFSTWNDFVRDDGEEQVPAEEEEEPQEKQDEGTDNEFLRRYFTRAPEKDFPDGDTLD